MRNLITLFARLFVVLAVAVAMTGSSFAHRAAPTDMDESLLAYVAAGGAVDDLCGQAGFGQGGGEPCDACRLVDGAVMPDSSMVALAEIDARLQHGKRNASTAPVGQVSNPSCPVRAPPVV